MITAASFRADYQEFANTVRYPDAMVNYWIMIAKMLLNQQRWGAASAQASSPPTTQIDVGYELFVAHNIVLERRALDEAARGAVPGISQGPVSAKSVGPVSVSYDTQASITTDAGHWNETIYGRRYIYLVNMMGAGPVQVGPGCDFAPFMSLIPMGTPWWGASVDLGFGPN